MEFILKKENPESQNCSCIVTNFFEKKILSETANRLDKISEGYISRYIQSEENKVDIGQIILLDQVPNIFAKRVLLIKFGKKNDIDFYEYKKIIIKLMKFFNFFKAEKVSLFLTDIFSEKKSIYWKIRQTIEIIEEFLYSFNFFKKKKNKLYPLIKQIILNISKNSDLKLANLAIKHGLIISNGINLAKDLGNMPPNICNSSYLAKKARSLKIDFSNKINITEINEEEMKKIGMNAYLSVGRGSNNESIMTIIEYRNSPKKDKNPIILVGKGLTFDSGGISIKSSDKMDEMKYDMCGAAAVYATMHIVKKLDLPLNIIGILAGCENMPSGNAFRPGDIITTMSGKTVEVLNTDAEGRLVLCDVFTYIEKFNPELVIDIATLTGACVIALGNHITGMVANCDSLAKELIKASKETKDYIWLLPMKKEFKEQLKSNFADLSHVGGKPGGMITAGCFLSYFTKKYRWVHLDIAGTAWKSGTEKCATGRPVALLSQFLINKSRLYS